MKQQKRYFELFYETVEDGIWGQVIVEDNQITEFAKTGKLLIEQMKVLINAFHEIPIKEIAFIIRKRDRTEQLFSEIEATTSKELSDRIERSMDELDTNEGYCIRMPRVIERRRKKT